MNFDDNSIFRRPEIAKLRDLNEEEPAEIEASNTPSLYQIKWFNWLYGKWCRFGNGNNGHNQIIWQRTATF